MTRSQSRGRPALTFDVLEDRLTPSSTALITSLYSNLLHRAPAQADLAYWVPLLDGGTPASTVTSEIVGSFEYQNNYIQSCYQLFLNHNPGLVQIQVTKRRE